jgi:hypothetical protein
MLINEELKNLDIDNNRVTSRECEYREFKLNYDSDKIWEYAKIMASFANKKGGIIFYGVRSNPRYLIGDNKDFDDVEIGNFLQQYFDPEIEFELGKKVFNGKNLNYILVFPSKNKPILCRKEKKLGQKGEILLRPGAIYYRYSSSSIEIKYSELKDIIDQKVKEVFSSLIDNIKLTKEIGYNNVAMVGLEDLKNNNKKVPVYMTKESVKNINWIKKGKFSEEKDASNAFYVTQEVTIMSGLKVYQNPEDDYPFIKKDLQKKLEISPAYINKILDHVGILKGGECNKKYSTSLSHGKTKLYKFNQNAVNKILEEYPLDLIDRKNLIKNLNNQKND